MQLRIKINKEAKGKTSFYDLKSNSNNNETKFLTKIEMKIKMIFFLPMVTTNKGKERHHFRT